MTMNKTLAWSILSIIALTGCNGSKAETNINNDNDTITMNEKIIIDSVAPGDAFVTIATTEGDIKVQLYGDTPQHRDNFMKLAKEGYYDGTLFHRVIRNFMIQAGDPESKTAQPGQMLGSGDPGYTLPAEIVYPRHFHRYGALAAARTGDQVNPERRSSGSQFYIVTGNKYPKGKLAQFDMQMKQRARQAIFDSLSAANRTRLVELRRQGKADEAAALRQQLVDETDSIIAAGNYGLTDAQRQAYEQTGGAPHLDGQYTVFGQVVDGMETVEKIQQAETNSMDRPVNDIKILKVTIE